MKSMAVREWQIWRGVMGRVVTGLVMAGAMVLPMTMGSAPTATAAQACETPFLVYTDPANAGETTQTGDVAVTRGGHLVGEYKGGGRFAHYAIDGTIDTIVNTTTGMARVQGEFVATSPDGGSSITVWYTGQVDFGAAMARGNFTAGSGSGDDAGYRASGTIAGTVVGPATLDGVDIGLC